MGRWTHLYRWVHQAGGPHHLFNNRRVLLRFVFARRGANKNHLRSQSLPLLKPQRSIIQGRGEPETIAHQRFLAGSIPFKHGPYLGHGDMRLINHQQRVLWQVIKECGRWLARSATRKVPRIVLDALAVAKLLNHLKVKARSLFQALGLHQLVGVRQFLYPVTHFIFDVI